MDLTNQIINQCYYVRNQLVETPFLREWESRTILSGYKLILRFLKKENKDYPAKVVNEFKKHLFHLFNLYNSNIAKIIEIDEYDGYSYYAVEQVNGITLKQILADDIALPFDDILFIILNLCKTMQYIHNNTLFHLNISPENIVLLYTYNVLQGIKIDRFEFFELEKLYPEISKTVNPFMAPEAAARDYPAIDQRADVYSIGAVFYQMVTKQIPYHETTSTNQKNKTAPIPPSEINESIPQIYDKIILAALELEKENRFQNCTLLMNAIQSAREHTDAMNKSIPHHFTLIKDSAPDAYTLSSANIVQTQDDVGNNNKSDQGQESRIQLKSEFFNEMHNYDPGEIIKYFENLAHEQEKILNSSQKKKIKDDFSTSTYSKQDDGIIQKDKVSAYFEELEQERRKFIHSKKIIKQDNNMQDSLQSGQEALLLPLESTTYEKEKTDYFTYKDKLNKYFEQLEKEKQHPVSSKTAKDKTQHQPFIDPGTFSKPDEPVISSQSTEKKIPVKPGKNQKPDLSLELKQHPDVNSSFEELEKQKEIKKIDNSKERKDYYAQKQDTNEYFNQLGKKKDDDISDRDPSNSDKAADVVNKKEAHWKKNENADLPVDSLFGFKGTKDYFEKLEKEKQVIPPLEKNNTSNFYSQIGERILDYTIDSKKIVEDDHLKTNGNQTGQKKKQEINFTGDPGSKKSTEVNPGLKKYLFKKEAEKSKLNKEKFIKPNKTLKNFFQYFLDSRNQEKPKHQGENSLEGLENFMGNGVDNLKEQEIIQPKELVELKQIKLLRKQKKRVRLNPEEIREELQKRLSVIRPGEFDSNKEDEYFKKLFYSLFDYHGNIYLMNRIEEENKNRLFDYFKDYMKYNSGILIHIDCSLNKDKKKYYLFHALLNQYLKEIYHFQKKTMTGIMDNFKETFKETFADLLKFYPGIKEVLTEAEQSDENQLRLNYNKVLNLFKKFFNHLEQVDHPLIIIINEIDRIDPDSFELLITIKKQVENLPVLILGIGDF